MLLYSSILLFTLFFIAYHIYIYTYINYANFISHYVVYLIQMHDIVPPPEKSPVLSLFCGQEVP